jgi:hypothetical protein
MRDSNKYSYLKGLAWVLSTNNECENTLRKIIPFRIKFINPKLFYNEKIIPSIIFASCDYSCDIRKCFYIYYSSNTYPNVPFALLRPAFIPPSISLSKEYWLDWIRKPDPNIIQERKITYRGVLPLESMRYLLLQRIIIDKKGKLFDLKSLYTYVSDVNPVLFKRKSGITLKAYINKVRLCNSMNNLISSNECIKTIARNYGYHPAAFSRSFKCYYGINPEDLRTEKGIIIFR